MRRTVHMGWQSCYELQEVCLCAARGAVYSLAAAALYMDMLPGCHAANRMQGHQQRRRDRPERLPRLSQPTSGSMPNSLRSLPCSNSPSQPSALLMHSMHARVGDIDGTSTRLSDLGRIS